MPPGQFPLEVFQAPLTGRTPKTHWRDYVPHLVCLVILSTLDNQKVMDGWRSYVTCVVGIGSKRLGRATLQTCCAVCGAGHLLIRIPGT